jgi:hypothetical protein
MIGWGKTGAIILKEREQKPWEKEKKKETERLKFLKGILSRQEFILNGNNIFYCKIHEGVEM